MESSGLIVEKFIKYVTEEDVFSDELRIPCGYASKLGDLVGEKLLLKLKTGYCLEVTYNKGLGKMIGVEALYSDFHLEGGELLVFEFAGDGNFNVYIIGRDFCEVEYPNVVHALQEIGPRKVSLVKGGLKFVKFVTESEPILDYMVAPISFAERCIHPLSLKCFVRYVLPNGKKINGLYDELTYKFSGLQTIPELLGNADLNSFNMLLLSYTEGAHLTISIFDDNFVEVFFPGSPLSTL
ncbi:hypothetical protein ACET3Z_023734 [Daucus carota]